MPHSTLVQSATHATSRPTGIGWALWVVAAALPWLSPLHAETWPSFCAEAMAAAVMVPIALWAMFNGSGRWTVSVTAAVLLATALIPLTQAAFGLFVFPGEATLVALYIGAFATTVVVARHAQLIEPDRLVEALLAALAVAALLSTGLALYQWFEQDWLGIAVHYRLVSGRAYANVGQPNNLATLLCWGLIALWWGHERRKMTGVVATVAAGFLLLGVVLTRSRTGWIEVVLLALVALCVRARHKTGPRIVAVSLLGLWFAVLTVGLEPMAHRLLREAPASLSAQSSAGLRPTIWGVALDEVAKRPLGGHGWVQGVPAYLAVADDHTNVKAVINYAHNLVLDLLVWNGVPLTLLILAGAAWWVRAQWRACRTSEQRLLMLALALLMVHALLELPHTYLFFLLPAAVMVGTLDALMPSRAILAPPRWSVGLVILALGAILTITVHDYQVLERDLQAAKLRTAGVHDPNPSPATNALVLGFYQTALSSLRTEPARDLSAERLADMRRALDRYPVAGALFRYAWAAALAGNPHEARWALERFCLLNAERDCETALQDWRAITAQGQPELSAVILPTSR